MPNRREPLTKDMVQFLIKKVAALNLPDGLYAVMVDWFIITLQACFRRIEWSQHATLLATSHSYQQNIHRSSAAFIQSDFSFRGPNDRSFSPSNTLNLVDIEIVRLKWRFQKHLGNGREIPFAKDTYPVSLSELFF